MEITDPPVFARVAPGPAEAVVEHPERLTRLQFADHGSVHARRRTKCRRFGKQALERFGIMGGNHAAGERDVGEVLAIGIEIGVRQVGRARKREAFSGGGRRPGLGR